MRDWITLILATTMIVAVSVLVNVGAGIPAGVAVIGFLDPEY